MFENGYGFADYIREYELNRAEGGLLRTINEVFKVLSQTVPDSFKNEDLKEIELKNVLKGIYLVRITEGNETWTSKIIKE